MTSTFVYCKGIATLIKSTADGTPTAVGYFISEDRGIFKVLLQPSNPLLCPLFHDCCQPKNEEEGDWMKKEGGETIMEHGGGGGGGGGGHNDSIIHFWDLTLKQGNQTFTIYNLQDYIPQSDVLNFSSSWSSGVLGEHGHDSGGTFSCQSVFVAEDAQTIQSKHFPFLPPNPDNIAYLGSLNIFFTLHSSTFPLDPVLSNSHGNNSLPPMRFHTEQNINEIS